MRLWAEFEKGARLRHIGHLDLMRAMQRALRRSGVPVAYSKGFNPHILLSFASALSVGAEGLHELMELTLEGEISPETFVRNMQKALPEDIHLLRAGILPEGASPLMARVDAAQWQLGILEEDKRAQTLEGLPAFLAKTEITALRKTKSGMKECNIRPLIWDMQGLSDGLIEMTLSQKEGETCKPSMVMDAWKEVFAWEEIPRVQLIRTHLMTILPDGKITPLEQTL